jgi:diadenosine tetraphosphate (Ap4A) HIT family hydrolase
MAEGYTRRRGAPRSGGDEGVVAGAVGEPEDTRRDFFDDMVRASEAIFKTFTPDKMNYEIQGNQVPHLHFHLIPRRNSDSVSARWPIWGQKINEQRLAHHDYRELAAKIAERLQE